MNSLDGWIDSGISTVSSFLLFSLFFSFFLSPSASTSASLPLFLLAKLTICNVVVKPEVRWWVGIKKVWWERERGAGCGWVSRVLSVPVGPFGLTVEES